VTIDVGGISGVSDVKTTLYIASDTAYGDADPCKESHEEQYQQKCTHVVEREVRRQPRVQRCAPRVVAHERVAVARHYPQ
jgi:hypothetical protein